MSQLSKLSLDNVVDFKLVQDKELVEIREQCDEYWATKLNKREFGELISELKVIHEQMEDNE